MTGHAGVDFQTVERPKLNRIPKKKSLVKPHIYVLYMVRLSK